MSTPDIAAVMAAAMAGENRRRLAASQSPGYGVQLALPQSPAAAAVGKSSLDMPAIGEGYGIQAEVSAAVVKSYGQDRPWYGPGEVGGYGYPLGIAQPAVRHVTFASPAPAARPSLLARLAARLRRR